MLPPVIEEGEYSPFKFWFEHTIQDGMYYQNELFYRLHTISSESRAQLYHYACQLAQHDYVVVTLTDDECSIWVSLRSPNITALSLRKQALPEFVYSQPPQ